MCMELCINVNNVMKIVCISRTGIWISSEMLTFVINFIIVFLTWRRWNLLCSDNFFYDRRLVIMPHLFIATCGLNCIIDSCAGVRNISGLGCVMTNSIHSVKSLSIPPVRIEFQFACFL